MRYVLEGSVQPSGDLVRVNAQLIDAGAARICRPNSSTPPAPMLQTQDAIVAHLATPLDLQLVEAEALTSNGLPRPIQKPRIWLFNAKQPDEGLVSCRRRLPALRTALTTIPRMSSP